MLNDLWVRLVAMLIPVFALLLVGGCSGEPPTEAEIQRRIQMETLLRAAKPGDLMLHQGHAREGRQYIRVCVLGPDSDSVIIQEKVLFRCNMGDHGYFRWSAEEAAAKALEIVSVNETAYGVLANCALRGRYVLKTSVDRYTCD